MYATAGYIIISPTLFLSLRLLCFGPDRHRAAILCDERCSEVGAASSAGRGSLLQLLPQGADLRTVLT